MEYWGESNQPHVNRRRHTFPSLDYLKQVSVKSVVAVIVTVS